MELTFIHQPPPFFVPEAKDDDEAETLLEGFAQTCSRSAPPLAERVYGIKWVHDGQEWIAEVGQPLRGVERRMRQRRGQPTEVSTSLRDRAMVLAILPGKPYFVVTDYFSGCGWASKWANPLMAGRPTSTLRFAPTV